MIYQIYQIYQIYSKLLWYCLVTHYLSEQCYRTVLVLPLWAVREHKYRVYINMDTKCFPYISDQSGIHVCKYMNIFPVSGRVLTYLRSPRCLATARSYCCFPRQQWVELVPHYTYYVLLCPFLLMRAFCVLILNQNTHFVVFTRAFCMLILNHKALLIFIKAYCMLVLNQSTPYI